MPTRLCLLSLLLLLSAVPSAAAQTAPANVVTPAPPPREGTVGPEQLRDFALPGTRTSPAPAEEPAPTPAPARDRAQPARPAPQFEQQPVSTTEQEPARDATEAERAEERRAAPAVTTASPQALVPPAEQIAVGLGPPTMAPVSPPLPLPQATEAAPEQPLSAPSLVGSWWAWLLVAALAGVALALFLRRRGTGEQPAVAGPELDLAPAPSPPAPAPAPAPKPPSPAPSPLREARPPLPSGLVTTRLRSSPAPATPPPSDLPAGLVSTRLRPSAPAPLPDLPAGAIVSTRLRPSVEIGLEVTDVALTDTEAVLRFRLRLDNNGSAGARDLVIEALALNAGEAQDGELASFFQRPDGQEVAIAELARNGSAQLSHEVRMPRAAIRAYEVQGRRVFVPILAFNVGYRWGSANGRISSAFLLGHRQPGSDKLAPLALEDGGRRLGTIGVRRLENELRR